MYCLWHGKWRTSADTGRIIQVPKSPSWSHFWTLKDRGGRPHDDFDIVKVTQQPHPAHGAAPHETITPPLDVPVRPIRDHSTTLYSRRAGLPIALQQMRQRVAVQCLRHFRFDAR